MHTSTDLYKDLQRQKLVLEERIAGTSHDYKWRTHWQQEHQAVMRCLWALAGDYPEQVARKRYDPEWEAAWAKDIRDGL